MKESIGERVRRIRLERGLRPHELDLKANLGVGYTVKLETGQAGYSNPKSSTVEALAEALQVPPYILLFGDLKGDLSHEYLKEKAGYPKKSKVNVRLLPVLGGASCGKWKDANDMDYPTGHADEFIPAPTKDPNAFIVRAEGDSMINDQIKEGDYLVIEPNTSIKNGNIVLAWDPKNGCTIKKFYRKPDGSILLIAANPKYAPIEVEPNEDFRVYRVRRKIEEL